jgi:hypothetical protein
MRRPLYDRRGAIVSEPSEPATTATATTSGRRAVAVSLAIFLAILAAVYWPLFLGRIIFTRDIAHWIFPARAFVRDSWLSGELPVWNPYQGLGFPVLGDPLYGVFYPPNWLLVLVPSPWLANALSVLDFLHMAWGGLGLYVLARRLRAVPLAAAVAGLAWSLSGYMTAQWTAGLRLHAGAWIPWIAVGHLALRSALRSGGRRWMTGLVKAAAPIGMAVLMGEMFLAIMGMGFAFAMVVVVELDHRQREARDQRQARPREQGVPWRLGARRLVMHALAIGLGLGVGAVVIAPARAVMAGSPRAAPLERADAEVSSLHPLRLVEMVAPKSMGDVYGDYPAARVVGEPRLDGLPLSYSVYLGASVLALALLALRRRALVVGIAGVTVLALLVAMGKYLPLHALVRTLVPPLAYMRFPEKYLTLVVVGVALLAGLGVQRLLSTERAPWRRTAILLGVLVAAGIAAPFVFPFPWSGYLVHGLRHGAVAVLSLLGVHVLVARGSRLAAPMLVATVALDLAVSTWGLQGFVPRSLAATAPASVEMVKRDHHGALEPPRLYRAAATDAVMNRVASVGNPADGERRLLATLIPNTVNAWGVATVPGYDAAIPSALDRLWAAGWRDPSTRLATLRLLGVDYVVLPTRGPAAPMPGLDFLVSPAPGARLLRVRDGLPDVFLAGRGEPVADDEALRRLFEPAVTEGGVALLAPGSASLDGQPGRVGDCTVTGYAPRHVEADCEAERAALAVFVEQFESGWHASVDGRPADILRANLVMRALPLAPGRHRIVLDYRAPGLVGGLAISALALAALLGLAVIPWLASRRQRAS